MPQLAMQQLTTPAKPSLYRATGIVIVGPVNFPQPTKAVVTFRASTFLAAASKAINLITKQGNGDPPTMLSLELIVPPVLHSSAA